jgi:diguanylate cyclase (GGDEF)-like protein
MNLCEDRAGVRVFNCLLGTDPRQRRYLTVTLTATAAYAVCALLQWHAVRAGLADPTQARWLLTMILLSQVGFFLLIRLGLVRRLADPALTLPQMAVGVMLLAWAYHINLPVRGAVMGIAGLVVSYSALTSQPRQCLATGIFTVVTFGLVMGLGVAVRPGQLDATIELLHFGLLTPVILTLAFLASRLSDMRMKLREQRNRLTEALAQLEAIATLDVLTGLPNRRYTQQWLAQATAQCQRQSTPLSVVVIDIDHFKRINDTLGHAAGDAVLARFAGLVRCAVRDGDLIGRWGGEEFVWVMVGTDQEQASTAIERMRSMVSRPEIWLDMPGWTVSFSAGVAALDQHPDIDAALRRADDALYAAKRAGRGCTLVAA